MPLPGVDVSRWQGVCNWKTIYLEGHRFGFAKASEGLYTDPTYQTNMAGMKNARIYRSAYHFFRSNVDPLAQANLFAKQITLSGRYIGDFPPAVDVETSDSQTAATITSRLYTFIRRIVDLTNERCIIYTSPGFWNYWIKRNSWAKDYLLWVANYGVLKPTIPYDWSYYGKTWTFWQFSSKGTSAGDQSIYIDLDYFNGDLAGFVAKFNPPTNYSIYLPTVKR